MTSPMSKPGKVTPYGACDIAANDGFVNVGTDHDTAAFAVESIRCWWNTLGKDRYPQARRLLVTADAGGSNGYRTGAWKTGLADLARDTGLEITVCHFPPGTSKWNKIEHRLFSQISRNWRARPLTSHEVIVNTIAATTTTHRAGRHRAAGHPRLPPRRQDHPCAAPGARRRRRADAARLPRRMELHHQPGRAQARPALAAAGTGPPYRDQAAAALAHPALTGMTARDLGSLVTRLELPAAAAREHYLHLARGHPRRRAGSPPKLTLTTQITATLARARLGLPLHVLAYLLGVHPATLSAAIKHTSDLLARHDIAIPAGPQASPPCTTCTDTPPPPASPSPAPE